MSDLIPYEETERCSKCGYRDIAVTYHEAEEFYKDCRIKIEHLFLCCRRCAFIWQRACIDAACPPEQDKEYELTEGGQALATIIGKWPGDESDEEIADALEELS